MAVPKRKTSKARKRKRRSHHGLTPPSIGRCPRCDNALLPHTVCDMCGYYRGKQIVKIVEFGFEET